MEQGHPKLTKENFLSDTERSQWQHTFPNRALFHHQSMLYVHHNFGGPHGPVWNKKVLKLKFYLALINTSNISDLQKSEQLITRTAKKLKQSLLQCKNKDNKNIFSEYQDIRFWQKLNKPPGQEKWHSHHHKKLLKVISFCLWIQFCGAGNSSKNT